MFNTKSSLVLAAVLLSACSTPPPLSEVKPDPATATLANLLRDKAAATPIGPETPVAGPIYGSQTSVSFLGDAATLLANAAKGRGPGWKFEAVGPQPHLPIYVQIHVKDVTFAEFLKSVAEQLGQRADIELSNQSIKLRYRAQG